MGFRCLCFVPQFSEASFREKPALAVGGCLHQYTVPLISRITMPRRFAASRIDCGTNPSWTGTSRIIRPRSLCPPKMPLEGTFEDGKGDRSI
jgi:hypothetical protein